MNRPRPRAASQPAAEMPLIKARFESGDYVGAIHAARQLLARQKNHPDALYALGVSQLHIGHIQQATEALEKAVKVQPRAVGYHAHLACAYQAAGAFDKAAASFARALSINPRDPFALSCAAEFHLLRNDLSAAGALLDPLAAKGFDHHLLAAAYARLCQARDEPEKAIAALRAVVSDPRYPEPLLVTPLFQLGDLLDRTGEYDEAFEVYRRANAARGVRHAPGLHASTVETLIREWSAARVKTLPRASAAARDTEKPVFVVGMPRSGTSLVEQILAALPGVFGAGELEFIPRIVYSKASELGIGDVHVLTTPQILTQLSVNVSADDYLSQINALAPHARRVIDKMPLNFLHLGVIALLFPKAHIIHCSRDPLDTCLSCYFQNFGSAMTFPYDLQNLGAYYRDYERLMNHWKSVLEVPMLDVRYEELVAQQETQSRCMAEFIGVPWDDAALRFHESDHITNTASNQQVRRPLYASSVGRWKHYETHIEPLRRALQGP